MRCSRVFAGFVVLFAALPGAAQSSDSAAAPAAPQDPAAVQTPAQISPSNKPAPSEVKKPKKVWTNDNVSDANGAISVVGNSRNSKYKLAPDKPADPQVVARIRKDLNKLQEQMDDTDKKLAVYKDFQNGEAVSTNVRQLDRGVGRIPIDQQISSLQEKKKQIQIKIDALLDEAREKGVLPGQLR
jgi:hypothetical protein